MNLGLITTWMSRFANDVNQTRYQGMYTDAANSAQQQFALDTGCLFKDQAYSVVDGTATYSLPSDFMYERKVTLNGKQLIPATRSDLEFYKRSDDWTDDAGTPTHYIVDPEEARKQLRLYPIPQSADAGTSNLIMTYYPLPTDLSASSDVPFNSSSLLGQFHMAVAVYGAWLLLATEEQTPEIIAKRMELLKQYTEKHAEAVQKFGNTVSAPIRMRGGRVWR